jgi:hypothetical protein
MSTFTAGGQVLEKGGSFTAKGALPMLKRALAKYRPEKDVQVPRPPAEEVAKLKRPPEGGLACYVTWKARGDFRREGSATTGHDLYAGLFQRALGVDRLWARKDEAEALARGEFPDSLKKRILPHVDYAVAGKVKSLKLSLKDGRLTGSFRTDVGDEGELLGFVQAKGGRVTRFDLLVTGSAEQVIDCGFSASLTVIPKGKKVPVAILFTLADPADELARVVPLRANSKSYLK